MGYPVVPTGAVIVWLLIAMFLLVSGVFGPVLFAMLVVRRYAEYQQRRHDPTSRSRMRLPIRRALLVTPG